MIPEQFSFACVSELLLRNSRSKRSVKLHQMIVRTSADVFLHVQLKAPTRFVFVCFFICQENQKSRPNVSCRVFQSLFGKPLSLINCISCINLGNVVCGLLLQRRRGRSRRSARSESRRHVGFDQRNRRHRRNAGAVRAGDSNALQPRSVHPGSRCLRQRFLR